MKTALAQILNHTDTHSVFLENYANQSYSSLTAAYARPKGDAAYVK